MGRFVNPVDGWMDHDWNSPDTSSVKATRLSRTFAFSESLDKLLGLCSAQGDGLHIFLRNVPMVDVVYRDYQKPLSR